MNSCPSAGISSCVFRITPHFEHFSPSVKPFFVQVAEYPFTTSLEWPSAGISTSEPDLIWSHTVQWILFMPDSVCPAFLSTVYSEFQAWGPKVSPYLTWWYPHLVQSRPYTDTDSQVASDSIRQSSYTWSSVVIWKYTTGICEASLTSIEKFSATVSNFNTIYCLYSCISSLYSVYEFTIS